VLGREHALSGLAAGAAAGEWVLHLSPGGTAVLAGLAAAMATLPDLDQCESSATRSLGWLSEAFAWVVGKVSGGHRHATHSVIGVAAFTVWAWAAYHWHASGWGRAALGLLLALAFAAGLRALHLGGHLTDTAAVIGGVAIALGGWGERQVVLATGLGCAVHIAGDMLTTRGCPIAWPVTMWHAGLPEPLAFDAGAWQETWVVLPVLLIAVGWLGAADAPVHPAWTGRVHLVAAGVLAVALAGLIGTPHIARRRREQRRW
jgi:membrane-bound metal-dependent hydrolase YbcI (DUF457 family)